MHLEKHTGRGCDNRDLVLSVKVEVEAKGGHLGKGAASAEDQKGRILIHTDIERLALGEEHSMKPEKEWLEK